MSAMQEGRPGLIPQVEGYCGGNASSLLEFHLEESMDRELGRGAVIMEVPMWLWL